MFPSGVLTCNWLFRHWDITFSAQGHRYECLYRNQSTYSIISWYDPRAGHNWILMFFITFRKWKWLKFSGGLLPPTLPEHHCSSQKTSCSTKKARARKVERFLAERAVHQPQDLIRKQTLRSLTLATTTTEDTVKFMTQCQLLANSSMCDACNRLRTIHQDQGINVIFWECPNCHSEKSMTVYSLAASCPWSSFSLLFTAGQQISTLLLQWGVRWHGRAHPNSLGSNVQRCLWGLAHWALNSNRWGTNQKVSLSVQNYHAHSFRWHHSGCKP